MDKHAQPPNAQSVSVHAQWLDLMTQTSSEAKAILSTVATRNAKRFAEIFFETLLSDPKARGVITQEMIDQRLQATMESWILRILSTWDPSKIEDLVAQQHQLGVMHGRMAIRIELVLQGARMIKRSVSQAIMNTGPADLLRIDAAATATGLIDLAVEIISTQYANEQDQANKTEESYRTFASTMNATLERERQHSALLGWENQFLKSMMVARPETRIAPLGQSSFGLWLRHKAPTIFTSMPEMIKVISSVDRIDRQLIPQCHSEIVAHGDQVELRRLSSLVINELKEVSYLTDSLFESLGGMESGRDALTQLLNRRFLPTILTREINLTRLSRKPFSALLIDIDDFMSINEKLGRDAGDRVLQRMASIVTNCLRSGDFVFRHGGTAFMAIVVEVTPDQAMKIAEKIRQAARNESIILADLKQQKVTVSIAVAPFDGHPDYQRLIDRTEHVLGKVHEMGPDQCLLDAGSLTGSN